MTEWKPVKFNRTNCDLCGFESSVVVSTILKARTNKKFPKGFYPDDSIKLCVVCLADAVSVANRHMVDIGMTE